jgi:hypothetical protein
MAPNKNYAKWRLMKQIEQTLRDFQAQIFGGYVRDSIIHDHYATLFYETADVDTTQYANVKYLPQTSKRTLIPNDIDCFMLTSQIPSFKQALENKLLHVIDQGCYDANFYFKDIPPHLKHTKLKVTFAINTIVRPVIDPAKYAINIDIIHSHIGNLEPPFGCVDFECNSLVLMPSNDYHISKFLSSGMSPMDKLKRTQEIVSNIIKKETKLIYPNVSNHRICHMLQKGWKITSSNIEIVDPTHSPNMEEHKNETCFVCLEAFTERTYAKFLCCNARMHGKCLHDLFKKTFLDKCPMCREPKIIKTDDIKISQYLINGI